MRYHQHHCATLFVCRNSDVGYRTVKTLAEICGNREVVTALLGQEGSHRNSDVGYRTVKTLTEICGNREVVTVLLGQQCSRSCVTSIDMNYK